MLQLSCPRRQNDFKLASTRRALERTSSKSFQQGQAQATSSSTVSNPVHARRRMADSNPPDPH
eukprot:1143823-Pelagomonas_calceolata.AAC.2